VAPTFEALGAARGLELVEAGDLVAEDWLARWREEARPFPVGERLWLDPREPETAAGDPAEVPAGRLVLSLPARRAFGTGSHESTRLPLLLLEEQPPTGKRVLDVGTGTGVLALAALGLGAARAVAFDIDPVAGFAARDNGRRNGCSPEVYVGTVAALSPAARFDLVLANLLPEEVWDDLPRLAAALAPGGELILSGVLAEGAAVVLGRLAELGLGEVVRRVEGEWVAFRAVREPR
jgi:ribosomal protein L11 methyltransferase